MIPLNSTIQKIELMYRKKSSQLCGIKFMGSFNVTLVSCGDIDNIMWRNDSTMEIR